MAMATAFVRLFLVLSAAALCAGFSTTPTPCIRAQQLPSTSAGDVSRAPPDPSAENTVRGAPLPSRRALLVAAPSLLVAGLSVATPASATDDQTYVRGTVALHEPGPDDALGPAAALYVTARPARPDNVPRAILDGSRGKPPPVLAARFAAPAFPFDFALTARDLTPEGAAAIEGATGPAGAAWWAEEDLIVSARLDSDGIAATRDPTDLVGRGVCSAAAGAASTVAIELGGRGIFGKSVTGRK